MFIRVWHFGAVYCTINQFISLSTVRKNPIEKRRFFTAIVYLFLSLSRKEMFLLTFDEIGYRKLDKYNSLKLNFKIDDKFG